MKILLFALALAADEKKPAPVITPTQQVEFLKAENAELRAQVAKMSVILAILTQAGCDVVRDPATGMLDLQCKAVEVKKP